MPPISKIYNVVRHLDSNLGDKRSSPCNYFPWMSTAQLLDPHEGDFERIGQVVGPADLVVVGGGGQVSNSVPLYDQNLERVSNWQATSVAWGIGHNRHESSDLAYPGYLDRFDLVGVRDHETQYPWVPCASCLEPGIDIERVVTRGPVLYEHWQIPTGIEGIPRMLNSEPDMERVLAFMGSAEAVVTNTYHGWYWATLMQRPVVLVDPFSTKFSRLPYPPIVSHVAGWRKAVARSVTFDRALDECRSANIRFAEQVQDLARERGVFDRAL